MVLITKSVVIFITGNGGGGAIKIKIIILVQDDVCPGGIHGARQRQKLLLTSSIMYNINGSCFESIMGSVFV